MNIDFELEENTWWKTTIKSSVWDTFKYREVSTAPDIQELIVIFAPEGRDTQPLSTIEVDSVKWVLDNEIQIQKLILNELLEVYPNLQTEYGYDAEELNQFMPNVSSTSDFQNLISLRSIFVHPLRKDGFPYVGFEFETSWDPEHGLGVLAHENRVVEIGGGDTAMLLWIAERDAKNP